MKALLGVLLLALMVYLVAASRRHHGNHNNHDKAGRLQYNQIGKSVDNERDFDNRINTEDGALLSPCDDCKSLVNRIKAVIDDQQKLQELKEMLNLFCDTTGSYKEECKEIVQNIDNVAQELKPFLDNPEEVCRELHLCGSNERVARVLQVFLLFVKKAVYQIDDPAGGSGALCDECKFAMTELKALIEDKSIQDEIKQELDDFCGYLGSIQDECKSLIDQFYPELIQELEQLLNNPEGICSTMGLCGTQRLALPGVPLTEARVGRVLPNVGLNKFRFLMTRLHTKDGLNVGCIMCKYSIRSLVDAIKDDSTILDGVEDAMKQICGIMPSLMYKPGCEDFLNEYAKPVIILTLEQINSKQLCQDLHVCSAHEMREMERNRFDRDWKNEVMCDSCKTLAEFLKYECSQRSFQVSLANEAKQLCDTIPSSLASQCDNLMDQYIPLAIQMLVEELEPNTICPEIHLCPERRSSLDLQTIEEDK